jgi:hypothetical protein
MGKQITAKTLVARHVRQRDRVLLLNPPVEETRYSWVRWNQPLDLLKIGGFLKSQVGCQVAMLDLMKPNRDGRVAEEWLRGARRYKSLSGERYPMRRYGQPHNTLSEWLLPRRSTSKCPTQVWVTSLCSYWFPSIAEMCRVVRRELPDAQIILLGQYPRLMPEHACERCIADHVVTKGLDLEEELAAFDLYGDAPPPFAAVRLNPASSVDEIKAAVERRVFNITIFDEDICRDGGEPLAKIISDTRGLHRHLRFHITCGLYPDRLTRKLAELLADRRLFSSIHFEECRQGGQLHLEAYRRSRAWLEEAGLKMPDERLSGFVWIGRPEEQLEELVLRSFHVLNMLGGLILKPFSPTPGGAEDTRYAEYLASVPCENRSPHFFPFSELNGITRTEYHDLYRMAAFLNERVRNRAFDFLNGTLGARFLRESLRKEVWNLEPSPLRIID